MISPGRRNLTLGLLLLVYTSNFVDRSILSSLLEPIKAELALADWQLGFLGGFAFAAFYATLGVPIAMLADRGNRRRIITLSLATWSAMTVATGFAQNFVHLLLARIGVGIGEAGGSPPAYSIIADLYPLNRRATAIAIYSLGVPLGILVGFLVGGFVSRDHGWRAAFLVVGAPGLVLALIVHFLVVEPVRGASDREGGGSAPEAGPSPSLGAVLKTIATTPSLVQLYVATTVHALIGYAYLTWLSSFLARTHHMGLVERSMALALIIGLGGAIGNFAIGWAADRFGRRDARWKVWILAMGVIAVQPIGVAAFLAEDGWTTLALFFPSAMAGSIYLGPCGALVPALVGLRMRATAIAINQFLLNFIGLGIGPWALGLGSDLLQPTFGDQSLRWALIGASFVSYWAAYHYWRAGRTLRADLETAARAAGMRT